MKKEKKRAAAKLRDNLRVMTIENKYHSYEDIYIVDDGACVIDLSHTEINEEETKLYGSIGRGQYFGVQSLFKMQSHEYYGDIYAANNDTMFYKISRTAFEKIPFCERKIIQDAHTLSMKAK